MLQEQEATSPEVSETTEAPVVDDAPVAEAKEAPAEEVKAEVSKSVEKSFLDSLDSEIRESKALKDFKDINGLAKSYLHLNSMIGKKVTDLSPEELNSVYSKLGRPESQDGYELPDSVDPQAKQWYSETAFELGLNQEQAKGLAEKYLEIEKTIGEQIQASREKQQEEWGNQIKEEFGPAFEQRVETAKKAIEAFGGDELRQAMNETGLGNHPSMVKAFAKIGKEMLEGKLTSAEAEAQFGMTPEDAQRRISALKRDPQFMKAYMTATHPEHKAAVDEIQSYYVIMNSGGKK